MVIDYQAVAKASTPGSAVLAEGSNDSASPISNGQVAEVPLSPTNEPLLDPSGSSAQARTEHDALQLSTDELLNRKLDELQAARQANKQKDSEIAMLKKEATRVKKELLQRTEEVKALKTSKASAHAAPKKKAAEAHRMR